MTTTFATRAEAIEREIAPALTDWAQDYDLEAIARDVLVWTVEHNERGDELLNTAGYRMRDDVDFWDVVARHEVAATSTYTVAREGTPAANLTGREPYVIARTFMGAETVALVERRGDRRRFLLIGATVSESQARAWADRH